MKLIENINIQSVLFLEADSNYTKIILEEGQHLLSSFTLGRHANYFPEFVRVSRKYMLNPYYIKNYMPEKRKVTAIDGRVFKVSRRRLAQCIASKNN